MSMFFLEGVNMDATVKSKLNRVIGQLNSLKDNSKAMINDLDETSDNQIWLDDVTNLDIALIIIEFAKYQHDTVNECIKLLSVDGNDTKKTVREMLISCCNLLSEYIQSGK